MMSKTKTGKMTGTRMLIFTLSAACLFILLSCNQRGLVRSHEKVYEMVEQMPEYPGGSQEMLKFVASSVRYPVKAQENRIQGKVFVGFVVGRDGLVKDVKVVRGVDPLLDEESVRVVNTFPVWTPGKQKGKLAAVRYTLPINFILQ